MSSNAITFARAATHNMPLAKIRIVKDGRIIGGENAPQAKTYRFREATYADLGSLMAAVEKAASLCEVACRGQPIAPVGRKAIHADAEKGPAGLTVEPRTWVALDWDGLPIRPFQPTPADPEIAADPAEAFCWALPDPLADPEIGVQAALRRLPEAFRLAATGWQVTASAGLKPGWRLRTWHLLSKACTGEQIKTWLKPAIDRNMVDPSTLVEAQSVYLGIKFQGGIDPCPRRFGIYRADLSEAVQVPSIQAIKTRQETAANARRRACGLRLASGTSTLDAWLNERVALVASATEGQRHPTYKHEACRAQAACDKHGIEWAPWRDRFIQAYEATLTAGEIRERRKGSTLGMMDWLDRRS